MCTLILGRDVVSPGTVLLAANRDEDPRRPSDPPGVLSPTPPVVGGRDRLGGGTWLAIRENRAAVALLNRHDPELEAGAPPAERRSRGLLTLDVARATGHPLSGAARSVARESIRSFRYAPFTLVFASPEACWALALDGHGPGDLEIEPGWHVITHREVDDAGEPRTAYLMSELAGFRPESLEVAEARLHGLLSRHGGPGPPVCLHEGRMVTVSSSLVFLDGRAGRYRHIEGRPCESDPMDHSGLLGARASR